MLNPMRELIHRGRVYRQPESIGSSWSELVVLLFDNYRTLGFVIGRSDADALI